MMSDTLPSEKDSNKPNKNQISQLIFLFLMHYFNWESKLDLLELTRDEEKHKDGSKDSQRWNIR